MNVELALKINKKLHDITNDCTHDIGMTLLKSIEYSFNKIPDNIHFLSGSILGTLHKYNINISIDNAYEIGNMIMEVYYG